MIPGVMKFMIEIYTNEVITSARRAICRMLLDIHMALLYGDIGLNAASMQASP